MRVLAITTVDMILLNLRCKLLSIPICKAFDGLHIDVEGVKIGENDSDIVTSCNTISATNDITTVILNSINFNVFQLKFFI